MVAITAVTVGLRGGSRPAAAVPATNPSGGIAASGVVPAASGPAGAAGPALPVDAFRPGEQIVS